MGHKYFYFIISNSVAILDSVTPEYCIIVYVYVLTTNTYIAKLTFYTMIFGESVQVQWQKKEEVGVCPSTPQKTILHTQGKESFTVDTTYFIILPYLGLKSGYFIHQNAGHLNNLLSIWRKQTKKRDLYISFRNLYLPTLSLVLELVFKW